MPSGGTVWIQLGTYAVAGTHAKVMTLQAPLRGVTLGNCFSIHDTQLTRQLLSGNAKNIYNTNSISHGFQSPNFLVNGNCKSSVLALLLVLATPLHAGTRTDANYSITADTADAGGRRTTSASYSNDDNAGLIAGISTVASPSETAKRGCVAQLYEVGGFAVTASPSSLPEGTTRQVIGGYLLDDGTLLAVNAASVAWSAASPLTINVSGLVTAGAVYQDTMALVQGIYAGSTGSTNLTVLNVNPDNFGIYAGDGVGDTWQVQYFRLPPNPAAGPLLDPDVDG